jgi:hypothetical protein
VICISEAFMTTTNVLTLLTFYLFAQPQGDDMGDMGGMDDMMGGMGGMEGMEEMMAGMGGAGMMDDMDMDGAYDEF